MTGEQTAPIGDDVNYGTPEIKSVVSELMNTIEEFHKKTDQRINEMSTSVDKKTADVLTTNDEDKLNKRITELKSTVESMQLEQKRNSRQLQSQEPKEATPEEIEYKNAFYNNYIRKCVSDFNGKPFIKGSDSTEGFLVPGTSPLEMKSLIVGSDPDGGYLTRPEYMPTIDRVVTEISDIRSISRVMQISSPELKITVNLGGMQSGWVAETASRPVTESPSIMMRNFPIHEIYANPQVSNSLLSDSIVPIESWIMEEAGILFAEQEGAAFVNGDGVGKPRGFVGGYDPIDNASFDEANERPGYVATGVSGGFDETAPGDDDDNIINLIYSIKTRYRSNSRFVMNRMTEEAVRKMRDADGQPYWALSANPNTGSIISTLKTFPVTIAEDMPDIAADSYSIAFGDFSRAYIIADRQGTSLIRDPFSSKPFTQFYMTRRVGGGVKMFEAYKLLKFGTS